MADLDSKQASDSTKLVGASTSGLESTFAKVSDNQDLGTSDVIDTAGIYGTLTVGTSAVQLKVGASNQANRKIVAIDNTSSAIIYWGYNNSITTSSYAGRIFKDVQFFLPIGPNVSIWLIASTAENNIHISEGA